MYLKRNSLKRNKGTPCRSILCNDISVSIQCSERGPWGDEKLCFSNYTIHILTSIIYYPRSTRMKTQKQFSLEGTVTNAQPDTSQEDEV
jgi:hypothetical protein